MLRILNYDWKVSLTYQFYFSVKIGSDYTNRPIPQLFKGRADKSFSEAFQETIIIPNYVFKQVIWTKDWRMSWKIEENQARKDASHLPY